MNSNYFVTAPNYPELLSLVRTGSPSASWELLLTNRLIPYLVQTWLGHYDLAGTGGEVVEVRLAQFSYLFDIGPDRLIAAWGISQGRFGGDRDKRRIQGYPVSNRPLYHAGHAIPHRLGGGMDINLSAQLGSMNTGPFRKLENEAVNTPGSLYFSYWMYGAGPKMQLASRIQQGLLVRGGAPEIKVFNN